MTMPGFSCQQNNSHFIDYHMNPNEPYEIAILSPADEEHLDEYIAREIFDLCVKL